MTFIQRRTNVDATSWRCIDVNATLYKRHVPIRSLPFSDIIQPGDPCSACEKKYTFRGSKKGIFTSPDFPNDYPDRTTCCYFFHAADDGRVKIEFDYFELEEPSDNGYVRPDISFSLLVPAKVLCNVWSYDIIT